MVISDNEISLHWSKQYKYIKKSTVLLNGKHIGNIKVYIFILTYLRTLTKYRYRDISPISYRNRKRDIGASPVDNNRYHCSIASHGRSSWVYIVFTVGVCDILPETNVGHYQSAGYFDVAAEAVWGNRTVVMYVCMYVCIRKFITHEFLQPRQSRVRARRPY